MNQRINIMMANFSDIDEICLIETQNYKFPWRKKSFEEEIKISNLKKGIFLVLKIDNKVVGYICCRIIQNEANIINISIKKEFQGLGYGTQLLSFLLKNTEEENIKNIYLEVRETNTIAQKLYQKLGFKKCALRKSFYPDKENAIIMHLNLDKKDLIKNEN